MTPRPPDRDLVQLRRHLRGLKSMAEIRNAGMLAAMGTPAAIGLSEFDATAVIEIAVAVARQASAEEVSSFLRTGRLPEVLRLTPRQMEHVRGGRTNLTASRGIAPELVVEAWVRRIETP